MNISGPPLFLIIYSKKWDYWLERLFLRLLLIQAKLSVYIFNSMRHMHKCFLILWIKWVKKYTLCRFSLHFWLSGGELFPRTGKYSDPWTTWFCTVQVHNRYLGFFPSKHRPQGWRRVCGGPATRLHADLWLCRGWGVGTPTPHDIQGSTVYLFLRRPACTCHLSILLT